MNTATLSKQQSFGTKHPAARSSAADFLRRKRAIAGAVRAAAALVGALILAAPLAFSSEAMARGRGRPAPAPAAATTTPAPVASGPQRRAFLVGIERYSDGYIQRLDRASNDAKDLGKDLEEVGFDKKNIKVSVDVSSRDAFEKDFSAFLDTIQPGDDVLFFFSGHGFGVEADQTNYLLFTDLKSPFSYTRSQLTDLERRNNDLIKLKIPQYLDAYQRNEIPNGVSANEIQRRLADKKPRSVIMIIDACRSLVQNDAGTDSQEIKVIKRGEAGSRLLNVRKPQPGFLILYSASFGEQAIQDFGNDTGRNSLFTGVLRAELQRPGQSAIQLGERVRLVVRSIANTSGALQEPEVFYDSKDPGYLYDFHFVGSIGGERFPMAQNRCTGEDNDWAQIKDLQKRELYERHIRRFDLCPGGTAEQARRSLTALALSSDDPVEVTAVAGTSLNDCDRFAASPLDDARGDAPGVLMSRLDPDKAIPACEAITTPPKSKSADAAPASSQPVAGEQPATGSKEAATDAESGKQPTGDSTTAASSDTAAESPAPKAAEKFKPIPRYFYNLGRAYQKLAMRPGLSEDERKHALESARFAYNDAISKGGYVSALNDLAELDELDKNYAHAVDLFKRAAQQNQPLAMYNLAMHYRDGVGVPRDPGQAAEWFARAADRGLVSAMVEWGLALEKGRGTKQNMRLAIEELQRAADAGSSRAERELGWIYYKGSNRDLDLALLWFSRAAEAGDSIAEVIVAQVMENGDGLPIPKPEVAERYWRLAAHGGDAFAEVEFADRLRRGFMLVKEEYGQQEVIKLLKQAMSQGSAQAAVALSQIYRTGELGVEKNPLEAMTLAYHAIDLAVLADPTSLEGNPYYEINAAHLLIEMARNGEAIDQMGRPLLTPEEIDRLDKFYGAVDPATKQVKIRRLTVPIYCDQDHRWWVPHQQIWVWDWGRTEPPTEFQIRDIERRTGCTYNTQLRGTLNDVYEQAKKNNVAFADLLYQKVQTMAGKAMDAPPQGDRRGHRRRR